jgi:hypothetical protein
MSNEIIIPEEKTKVKRQVKKQVKIQEEALEPKWSDLYFILSDASECFLRHITRRNDVPEDVIDIIRGVIALRETRDMFVVEGDRLTKKTALFWSDRLKEWASK